MTIRNLDALFHPASIALIGASNRPHSVGNVVARNLFQGGFAGPIFPVNPHEAAIGGTLAYRDVSALPMAPDLAIIATPPETVPELIAQLGARGTRGAVVLTAGFGESGTQGRALQQAVLDAARPHMLRIIGPNCLGVAVPGIGLNASFSPGQPQSGELAFVTQSGAILTSMMDWARSRAIGFSHLVSLGDMADVDFGDMLDYLALDPRVRAVLLYVEVISDARKFMSAARTAARLKPVIVVKAGRRPEGAKAATSHTGALAGADDVYDAAFRRAGMLRVLELEELFTAVETLASGIRVTGDRLAILTNGGGVGVMATDCLIEEGGRLAELSPSTIERLNAVLPKTWSKGNPVDIIGDAPGSRYADAMAVLIEDPGVDGILTMNCPTAIADSAEAARAVINAASRPDSHVQNPRPAILTNWLGGEAAADARRIFSEHRIPSFETPELAVRAFMHLVRYQKNQELLYEVPPSLPDFGADQAGVAKILKQALECGRDFLTEPEAKAVLETYGIRTAATRIGENPAAAAAHAMDIFATGAKSVALKILSPDITHKSDVGGVVLNLGADAAVLEAAHAMARRIAEAAPKARIEGFVVEEMIDRPDAVELILGAATDRTFGPILLFGHGGTAVEIMADKAIALPPLNLTLAHDLIRQTRVAKLMQSFRGKPAADIQAVAEILVKISQIVIDHPGITEIDINPLLVDSAGAIALDARVKVTAHAGERQRLAIRPYPKSLEDVITTPHGQSFRLRPIRPEDAPMIQAMIAKVAPEDMRLRFLTPLKSLPPVLAARLTQIDYDREMALVAQDMSGPEPAIVGVVRIIADPDNESAEYAVLVRSDLKGKGLGWKLMKRILTYAESRGIASVWGYVLRDNSTMLDMARELGFSIEAIADDPTVVKVVTKINGPCASAAE